MKVSYFPGCTLKNKAKELDVYSVKSAEVLGITLEEIENWQCCGGVYPLGSDEIASKLPSVIYLKIFTLGFSLPWRIIRPSLCTISAGLHGTSM